MKFIDTSGNNFDYENEEYLFEQKISDELSVVYQKNEKDIKLLLIAMGEDKNAESFQKTIKELLETRCTRRSGSCEGGCSEGSCKPFDAGNFSGCKCY